MLRKNSFNLFVFCLFFAFLPTTTSAKSVIDYTLLLNPDVIDVTIRVSLNDPVWREKNKDQEADKSICFEYDPKNAKNFWAKDPLYNALKLKKEGNNKVCVETNSDTFTFGYKVPISPYKGAVYTEDNQPPNLNVNGSILVFGKNTFLLPSYRDTEMDPLLYLSVRRNNLKRLASSIELNNERTEISEPKDLFSIVFVAGDISAKRKDRKENISYKYLRRLEGPTSKDNSRI
jgi:hypothetical protein